MCVLIDLSEDQNDKIPILVILLRRILLPPTKHKKLRSNENELIKKHKNLVISIAKSFHPPQSKLDDYIQCGYIGLLKAIRKHNPSKGKLTTIATPSIKWEILNYIRKNKKNNDTFNLTIDVMDTKTDTFINEYFNAKNFSDLERKIIIYKSRGMTLREIASKTNFSVGWISYLYHSTINKIKVINLL